MHTLYNPKRPLLEHGCQETMDKFLAGRNLLSQMSPIEDQKQKHDEKYRREVEYDERDTARGKPCFKKYRKDHVNKQSNCNAQYINNLHFYFGDGSQLCKARKPHYALDFVNTRGVDSECTAALKRVQVSSEKVTNEWLNETLQCGSLSSRLRRSYSCIHIDFTEEKPEEPTQVSTKGPPQEVGIFGVDSDMEFPNECQSIDASLIHKEVAFGCKELVKRINAPKVEHGEFGVSKVLFMTEELLAYVMPSSHNVSKAMKYFSKDFSDWLNTRSKVAATLFGTGDKANCPYWKWVNVVLFLPEYENEGTSFRRARHIHRIDNQLDLYLEVDSGEFRVLKSSPSNVRRLPQGWARTPIGIVEVSFRGLTTKEEVFEQIQLIRKKGHAFVGGFKKCDRKTFQESHNVNPHKSLLRPWSDMHRIILLPFRVYPTPSLTTFFCEDRDCMGMCGDRSDGR